MSGAAHRPWKQRRTGEQERTRKGGDTGVGQKGCEGEEEAEAASCVCSGVQYVVGRPVTGERRP